MNWYLLFTISTILLYQCIIISGGGLFYILFLLVHFHLNTHTPNFMLSSVINPIDHFYLILIFLSRNIGWDSYIYYNFWNHLLFMFYYSNIVDYYSKSQLFQGNILDFLSDRCNENQYHFYYWST